VLATKMLEKNSELHKTSQIQQYVAMVAMFGYGCIDMSYRELFKWLISAKRKCPPKID
jgi:hypothetical protein